VSQQDTNVLEDLVLPPSSLHFILDVEAARYSETLVSYCDTKWVSQPRRRLEVHPLSLYVSLQCCIDFIEEKPSSMSLFSDTVLLPSQE